MTNNKGILFFDLDGTVADSGSGILASMNHVLEARNLQPLTREDLTQVVGTGCWLKLSFNAHSWSNSFSNFWI